MENNLTLLTEESINYADAYKNDMKPNILLNEKIIKDSIYQRKRT